MRGKEILGVIGGVGSGKSSVLAVLKEDYGFHVIGADETAKRLMQPGGAAYDKIIGFLGTSILNEDGTISREALSLLIFSDESIRFRVNQVTHPLTWQAIFKEAREATDRHVAIETALPSKPFYEFCTSVWYIHASEKKRRERLKRDRGYSDEKIRDMMGSQDTEDSFRASADAVIDNSGTPGDVRRQIAALLGEGGQG